MSMFIKRDNVEAVKQLLAVHKGKQDVCINYCKSVEMLQLLFDHGMRFPNQRTALEIAIRAGVSLDLRWFIIANGLTKQMNPYLQTALEMVCSNRYSTRERDYTFSNVDIPFMRDLIEYGADIHQETSRGYTLLMLAVMANRLSIVKFLCESGVNIHTLGPRGAAIDLAVRFSDIWQYLSDIIQA
jgi:ankyrin repeat protein